MKEYSKINTIFNRDTNNIIMLHSGYVRPEVEWLKDCLWEATSKIDGTNTSIHLIPTINPEDNSVTYSIEYHGRTEKAVIPLELLQHLQTNYPIEKVMSAFGLEQGQPTDPNKPIEPYIIYGEGYGRKIQAGGNYIKDGVSFIVFDVRIGDWWLLRDAMLGIADKLGAPTVPYHGLMTIQQAIDKVKAGFKTCIPNASNPDYLEEGLVLKSPYGLRMRNGERLIVKIKYCDFQKYFNKYKTFDPVEQIPNPKYKEE